MGYVWCVAALFALVPLNASAKEPELNDVLRAAMHELRDRLGDLLQAKQILETAKSGTSMPSIPESRFKSRSKKSRFTSKGMA